MIRSLFCAMALFALAFSVGCGSGTTTSTPQSKDKDASKQYKVMTPGGAGPGTPGQATKPE